MLSSLCISCDSYNKRLGDIDFSVGWVNLPYTTGLHYDSEKNGEFNYGVLEGRITDVYWNDQYILAKQCEAFNDTVKAYFIIKILPDTVKSGLPYKKIGPLTENEYTHKKQELNLNEKNMKYENIFKRKFWLW